MSATDPLDTIWQALDRHGCQPRGPAHQFRARCPACEGNSADTLSIGIGADGRALLWCFRCGRAAPEIAAAAGVAAHELYPTGHHLGNPFLALPEAGRSEFVGHYRTVANVIKADQDAGQDYRIEIIGSCPFCGSASSRLVIPPDRVPFVHCAGGCGWRTYRLGLAGLVADRRPA